MNKNFTRSKFVIVLALLSVFILGWQLGKRDLKVSWQQYKPNITLSNQNPPPSAQNIDFKLFWNTWDLVSKQYVDKKAIDPQKMYYGAIEGMVRAIGDPYTVFLPPESQKNTKEELGGSFEGVGMQLGFNKDKRLAVIAPLSGTPADKAGIKPGDLIVKISGKDSGNLNLPEAVSLIRGPKGTKVSLEIYREGEDKPRAVDLTRDTIIVKSVEFQAKNTPTGKKIAFLKLSRFGDKTSSEWMQAVSDTLSSGAKGVVLDLRNNPGGYLSGAVFIASEFIPQGQVVVQNENSEGVKTPMNADRPGKLLNLPVVVLINKGSASASEIVAGAIADHKRGKLVGEHSFGKGTIQESQDLPGGTGIHITTAKWLTPDGRWIHTTGLSPDVKVESGTDVTKDEQLDKALELLDSNQ